MDEYNGCKYYPVVVIGAGASGIAMGHNLKHNLGLDQFVVFERQSGIGGTWWTNQYPGVACDVPMALYSFSFAPHYTSKKIYPSGGDYLEYLRSVVDKYGLGPKIQLNTNVKELRYIAESEEWEVTISYRISSNGDNIVDDARGQAQIHRTEKVRAKIIVSSVGILVEPNIWPIDGPSLKDFQGSVIHSSRLNDNDDFVDKKVVVVGSGCSAAQIVPALLKKGVMSLTQIMRTPPWVEPRLKEPFGKHAYERYAPSVFRYFPFLGAALRSLIFMVTELEYALVFQRKNAFIRSQSEKKALKHVRSKIPKKYHQMMTPSYSYGCKRRIFDDEWLESMNEKEFDLLLQEVEKFEPHSVQVKGLSGGKPINIETDVIILATGFQATKFLHPLSISGRGGVSLHEVWNARGGEQAYMGTAMDGFPNFFMTVGPNTFVGHSSVILGIEATIGYISKLIAPILRGEVSIVEPKVAATVKWTAEIQQGIDKTVFGSCNSWYRNENGWNSVIYPRSQIDFAFRCHLPRLRDWDIVYTAKGMNVTKRKRFFRRISTSIIAFVACAALVVGRLQAL